VVVGRDDGAIEMYDVDEAGELQQVYATKLGESITTLDGGWITSPNLQDFVVQTYSGKVRMEEDTSNE
jgi:Bardet-Biedl syndrome 7 protein